MTTTQEKIYSSVLSCIKKQTPITPHVFFTEESNIFIHFDKDIPDEETIQKLKLAFKDFGNPIVNANRKALVLFLIIRN